MEIEGEKAYPIYSFVVKWTEDRSEATKDFVSPKHPNGYEMPPDKIRNSMHHTMMFKEELSPKELELFFTEKILPQIIEKHKALNICDISHKIRLVEYEVWVCEWFSHMTFDIGLSDTEVLASFERFVDRTLDKNRKLQIKTGDEFAGKSLMGADDRWRWYANNPDGSRNETQDIPPPCRCVHCKNHGVIRINH